MVKASCFRFSIVDQEPVIVAAQMRGDLSEQGDGIGLQLRNRGNGRTHLFLFVPRVARRIIRMRFFKIFDEPARVSRERKIALDGGIKQIFQVVAEFFAGQFAIADAFAGKVGFQTEFDAMTQKEIPRPIELRKSGVGQVAIGLVEQLSEFEKFLRPQCRAFASHASPVVYAQKSKSARLPAKPLGCRRSA